MLKCLNSAFCLPSVPYLKVKSYIQRSNSNLKKTSKKQDHFILNGDLVEF